jgi:hypothetical protein
MRNLIRTVRPGGLALATAVACIAACIAPAIARAEVPLYEVAVPFTGATPEDRAASMVEALRAVAVKASGKREAASSPAIAGANPTKYVQRYSTTADKRLKVGFDGGAIEQLLQQAGLPLWPAERPVTVIDAPVTDRAALESVAQLRGLPVEWAAGVGVPPSSARRATLVGVPSGSEFAWTFTHDGRTTQARGSAESGIHLAADTLAARYAPASTRSSSNLTLRVDGMGDLADYSGLLAYLRGLSLVRGVEVESLDGTVITLRVVVRGDRELLGRIAALDGRLQPGSRGAEEGPAAVDFVYAP